MTKFVIFNVQLLPADNKTGEVGGAGYKSLLRSLRELDKRHRREHTLENFHKQISRDVFLGPKDFNVRSGFVYGNFSKYTRTNVVSDINRGKVVYRNRTKAMTVSKESELPFLFDTRNHHLAIDGGSGIKVEVLAEVLEHFFSLAKADLFPAHELHINVVSSTDDVERIISSAIAYKKIVLDVTFQNGGERTQKFLSEMKETRTQKLRVDASGGTSGKISRMPSFLEDMVRAAALVGTLQMTYYINGTTKKQTYNSNDSPMAFVCKWMQADDDVRYFARVRTQLVEKIEAAQTAVGAMQSIPSNSDLSVDEDDVDEDDIEEGEQDV